MNLKDRIKKLELKSSSGENIVLQIDDKFHYEDNIYSEDEFYKKYPSFKNDSKVIEIE